MTAAGMTWWHSAFCAAVWHALHTRRIGGSGELFEMAFAVLSHPDEMP